MPVPYLIAFASYAVILFVEKVAFDSHSLIEHEHPGGPNAKESHMSHVNLDHDEKVIIKDEKKKALLAPIDTIVEEDENEIQQKEAQHRRHLTTMNIPITHNPINALIDQHNMDDYNNDSDIDEETLKDVISSRGKFATYMQNRNFSKINLK